MKSMCRLVMSCLVLGSPVWAAQPPALDLPLAAPTGDGSEACLPSRWIGVAAEPGEGCPAPQEAPGWSVRRLFQHSNATDPLPPGLAPFCLYEHESGDMDTVPRLVTEGRLRDAAMDCAVVAPVAPPVLAPALQPILHERFLEHAGRIEPPAASPNVRLALLDSSPTAASSPEIVTANGYHGYSLAVLARDLLCEGSDCMARVTSRLVLPIVDFRHATKQVARDPDGGYLGTQSELAVGLVREVEAWRKAQTEPRLVLNLSVAWDGNRFGGPAPAQRLRPQVAAVYRALEHAACRGALVVAAAGNDTGGPQPQAGPMYPAGWETRPAPHRKACRKLLGNLPPKALFGGPPRPLVVAAGGVDAASEPLANARPGGMPRLVAYGDHASVPSQDGDPEQPAHALTGSSVAALVTSAASAAVWQHRPDLTPGEILQVLYDGGLDLKRPADVAPGRGTAPTQHRVTVCGAVAEACSAGGGVCPKKPLTCPTPDVGPLALAGVDLSAFDDPATSQIVALPELQGELRPGPPCRVDKILYDDQAAPPTLPCPFDQRPSLQAVPWSGPQPGSNPCPHCGLFPDDGCLMIEIDADFEGVLDDAVIQAGDVAVALPLPPLEAGDQAHVTGLDPALFEDAGESPVLVFTVDGRRSAMSPLLVGGK